MLHIDANVVLRYILGDNEELSPKAREIIDNNQIHVSTAVLAEVVYVLEGVYHVERYKINTAMKEFIELTSCDVSDADAVTKGIELYSENNLDFVDCLLAAEAEVHGSEIATFDKKLNKLIGKEQE